uniref:Uncharacterized protein n=2 Tax=Clytia hemisphaerica TaxID=252671 RepID=A0A7M5X3K9_9CNID
MDSSRSLRRTYTESNEFWIEETIKKLIPFWSEAFLAMSSQKSATAVYSCNLMSRELRTEYEAYCAKLEIKRRNWERQYDLLYEKRKRELQLQIEKHEAKLERLEEELRKRKLLKSQRKTNRNGKSVAKNESSVSREPLHVESFHIDDSFVVEKPSFVKESLIAIRLFVNEDLSQVLFEAEPINDVPIVSSRVVVEPMHTVIVEPIQVSVIESIPVVEELIEVVVELKRAVIVEPLHSIVVEPIRMECFSLVIESNLSFVKEPYFPAGLEVTQREPVIELNDSKIHECSIVHDMIEKLLLILVLQLANKWKSVQMNFYGLCDLDLRYGTLRLFGFLISRFWSSNMSLYLTVGSVTTF